MKRQFQVILRRAAVLFALFLVPVVAGTMMHWSVLAAGGLIACLIVARMTTGAGGKASSAMAQRWAARLGQHDRTNFGEALRQMEAQFEPLVADMADTISEATPTRPPASNLAPKTQQTEFKANLATGDPVVGVATVLPRRQEEEQSALDRLTSRRAVALFRKALATSREELKSLRETPELGEDERGIVDFQIMVLNDDALTKDVEHYVKDGLTLPESLNTTFALFVGTLEQSQNAYLRSRVADFLDLKHRLMDNVFRILSPEVDDFFANSSGKIVFCESVYPTDVVALYQAGAKGIVSIRGTASSHAEILLSSFNLPSLTNIDGLPFWMAAGRQVLVDTVNRTLIFDPTPEQIENLTQPTRIQHEDVITKPVTLASGEAVKVLATINNVSVEARRALAAGADGVGLFRSEMSYIGRKELPQEDELYEEYRVLTDAFSAKPVAMRMLDLGGDKLAVYQHEHEHEENPCMGNRSMRLLIRRPELFRTQLRAMLRSSSENTCILFPMISGWQELIKVQEMTQKIAAELEREGITRIDDVKYGIMVEVPGVVERFGDYVDKFDLFNIGSNDLTQYALAADRNNRNVAEYFSFYHPSVLSMLKRVCEVGMAHEKPVRLCGEMAGDLTMLPLLVGLGVREFSTHYYLIPKVKRTLQELELTACQELAADCLTRLDPRSVEEVVLAFQARLQPQESV